MSSVPHDHDAHRPHVDESPDPLAQVDPFAALLDARQQLLAAIEEAADAVRVAAALAAVIAHDTALRDIALAYADGTRDFADAVTPTQHHARRAIEATLDEAMETRYALFEALGAVAHLLDEVVTTPWGGRETLRMHLIVQAMHDGLHAEALVTGGPLPPAIAAPGDSE
jgi:hypothetical protein